MQSKKPTFRRPGRRRLGAPKVILHISLPQDLVDELYLRRDQEGVFLNALLERLLRDPQTRRLRRA